MLVYGDAPRRETAAAKLDSVRSHLREAERAGPWIVRHGFLVAALIEAGELAQGVADRASAEAAGAPAGDEAGAAMRLVHRLALHVGASWRAGERRPTPGAVALLDEVGRIAADGPLTIKLPEGFAHYALYPETYYEAALPLAGRGLHVVGIRSIGTTLAATVAAAANATSISTVRPVGHPFARELSAADAASLAVPPGAELAIVDEGPGLSGSSVAAVAEAALARGLDRSAIQVFPSHVNGPGPQASGRTRRFWRDARIHARSFDETMLAAPDPSRRLGAWFSDLIGEPIAPPRDVSGGRWREERSAGGFGAVPVHPWQERRKFIVETGDGTWLLRFAGLGRVGREKLALAETLASAGFYPRPIGLRHGFIAERWHADARAPDPFGPDRPRLLERLGDYLGFRARRCPADPGSGASAEQLLAMLSHNLAEEFGEEARDVARRWRPHLAGIASRTRRTRTDNRLHPWEWLLLRDGSILKSDALDHHAGHDLVGCQDVAWDVAGAYVEARLSYSEQQDVIARVERACAHPVDRLHVRFATLAYSAFQLGYYREAASSAAESGERALLSSAAERYAGCLKNLLEDGAGAGGATGG